MSSQVSQRKNGYAGEMAMEHFFAAALQVARKKKLMLN